MFSYVMRYETLLVMLQYENSTSVRGGHMRSSKALMLIGLFCCTACSSSTGTSEIKNVTGYVRFYSFEGGFYALRGDDSVTYDPTNLAKNLQIDGIRFSARLNVRSVAGDTHMVGPIVDILDISVPRTVSGNGCVEVTGTFNPAAPGFIVSYQSGVDPVATTARLETKYTFSASHVYTALPGFSAQLSTAALSGIRCESTVSAITRDGVGTIANL